MSLQCPKEKHEDLDEGETIKFPVENNSTQDGGQGEEYEVRWHDDCCIERLHRLVQHLHL